MATIARPIRKALDARPLGWDYNPSSWSQRVPIALVALLGFFISTYLALYQWRLIGSVWDPIFGAGSEKVLDSRTSEAMRHWMRIPDAALGAVAYFGDAIFGLAGSTRRWQYRPWLVLIFGFDVIPLGIVGAILVVLQGTVVGAWCFLCLVSAAISLLLVWWAYDEVWVCLVYLWRVWRQSRSAGELWKTFCGWPTPLNEQVGRAMAGEAR